MGRIHLVVISMALFTLLALASCIAPLSGWSSPWQGNQGGAIGQGGMMGGQGGMMGQGMMGGQGGMMGGQGRFNPESKQITIDDAAEAAKRYLRAYNGPNLALAEVMEFAWNFYAEVEEKDTGIHAMELLIDKYTGQVSPEIGPNMMWNSKYGMMVQMMGNSYRAGTPAATMSVTTEQARSLSQQFLDAQLPGIKVDDSDTFYGYYTLHTLKDGKVEGMLSVNGYTGAVWYHTWHGTFIGMKEHDQG